MRSILEQAAKIQHEVNAHPSTEEHEQCTIPEGGLLLVSTAQGAIGRDVAALVGASALNLQRLLADEDPPHPTAVQEALRGY